MEIRRSCAVNCGLVLHELLCRINFDMKYHLLYNHCHVFPSEVMDYLTNLSSQGDSVDVSDSNPSMENTESCESKTDAGGNNKDEPTVFCCPINCCSKPSNSESFASPMEVAKGIHMDTSTASACALTAMATDTIDPASSDNIGMTTPTHEKDDAMHEGLGANPQACSRENDAESNFDVNEATPFIHQNDKN